MSEKPSLFSVDRRFAVCLDGADFTFDAAHFVAFPPREQDAKNVENVAALWIGEPLHGHDFRVAVRVEGPTDAAGCVVDFLAARAALLAETSRRNQRVFLARRTPCAEYREFAPSPENPSGEIEIRWNGAPGPRRWIVPRDLVFWLDAVNASTEAIASDLLDDWVAALTATGALAASRRRFSLRLEESPGASVDVFFEQNN